MLSVDYSWRKNENRYLSEHKLGIIPVAVQGCGWRGPSKKLALAYLLRELREKIEIL